MNENDAQSQEQTVDVAAQQEAAARALPPGVLAESNTVAGEQPRASVVIARGPHDQPESGVVEGAAMMQAAHGIPAAKPAEPRSRRGARSGQ